MKFFKYFFQKFYQIKILNLNFYDSQILLINDSKTKIDFFIFQIHKMH